MDNDSVTDPALASFLEAAVAGNQTDAKRLLAELRPPSRADLFVAAMLGEAEAVEAVLERDPAAATRKGGPKNWDPKLKSG